jgi:hypothetical protein
LYQWDEKTKKAVIGYRSADYDCDRAIVQPEKPFYHWCLVTCLIPKLWHDEIGGYDEEMTSWEDVDYHYRLAKTGHCFIRVEEELVVYRFTTGARRQLGLEDHGSLIDYMRRKYKEIEIVGCGCRGGRSKVKRSPVITNQRVQLAQANSKEVDMSDQNFVLIRYQHPNKGKHPVIGTTTKTKYGMRASGDKFLVDRRDAQAQPHLFAEVQEQPIPAPPRRVEPPPPPPSLGWGDLSEKYIKILKAEGFDDLGDLRGIPEPQLRSIKGIGKATADKIGELLA